jgi:arginyl-tRNA synthetase
MSSRTGKVISGEWLLNEAQNEARKIIEESNRVRIEESDKESVSDMIGKAAIKWALLRSGVGKDVEFSFAESISFEGNSGPYVQYTYARTQSVLRKAHSEQKELRDVMTLHEEEKVLLRHLVTFEEIVLMAAERYSPNTVSTYLYELAQKFNNFYQKHQIIDSEQKEFRLALTKKVGETIKEGLFLLGIEAPDKM